jgi:hypothetical protein
MTITILSIVGSLLFAQPPAGAAWKKTEHGEMILRPFEHAPYPHPSRDQGFRNFPHEPHYVDSTVGIFIPSHFKPGDTVDYVVHFHGHKNHVANVMKSNKLLEQLAGTKLNVILIVPQGPKDAADSGGGKLELDAGAFEKLIAEVTALLKEQGKLRDTAALGKIVLTTHSGGYKVTAGILHHGGLADHITDVILLDSSYGSLERFAEWCKGSPPRRLVSFYTEHLADENAELMSMLDQLDVKYEKDAGLTDQQLRRRGVFFVPVTVGHGAVPTEYFGRMLATSAQK